MISRFPGTDFLRAAAIGSFISAATTLVLIFGPRFYQPVEGLEGRMALGENPAYLFRSWIALLHPLFAGTAGIAVARLQRQVARGRALVGLIGIASWGAIEVAQQTMTKIALDRTWRAAWLAADEATRAVIRTQVAMYDALWDSMYFLILVAFLIGNLFLGATFHRRSGLDRIVGIAFYAAAGLTLGLLIPELGGPDVLRWTNGWAYPAIQPLGRALIGVWLWRAAVQADRDSSPTPAATRVVSPA